MNSDFGADIFGGDEPPATPPPPQRSTSEPPAAPSSGSAGVAERRPLRRRPADAVPREAAELVWDAPAGEAAGPTAGNERGPRAESGHPAAAASRSRGGPGEPRERPERHGPRGRNEHEGERAYRPDRGERPERHDRRGAERHERHDRAATQGRPESERHEREPHADAEPHGRERHERQGRLDRPGGRGGFERHGSPERHGGSERTEDATRHARHAGEPARAEPAERSPDEPAFARAAEPAVERETVVPPDVASAAVRPERRDAPPHDRGPRFRDRGPRGDRFERGPRFERNERPERLAPASDSRGEARTAAPAGRERPPLAGVPASGPALGQQRVAVLVDAELLQRDAQEIGGEISYSRILRALSGGRSVIRAIAYVPEDARSAASTASSGGMELEALDHGASAAVAMAVDGMALTDKVDCVVFVPGSPALAPLARALRSHGLRVESAGFGPKSAFSAAQHHVLGKESMFVP